MAPAASAEYEEGPYFRGSIFIVTDRKRSGRTNYVVIIAPGRIVIVDKFVLPGPLSLMHECRFRFL